MVNTKITCPHCGNCDLEQFHWLENVVVHRRVLGIVGSVLKIEAGDLPTPTNRGLLMCMADGLSRPPPGGLVMSLHLAAK